MTVFRRLQAFAILVMLQGAAFAAPGTSEPDEVADQIGRWTFNAMLVAVPLFLVVKVLRRPAKPPDADRPPQAGPKP